MECWHRIEITASGRPILREGERDIFIDYAVGLYDGKHRVADKQSGRVFLTSQRIIYVDDKNAADHSVFLELDNVRSTDYSSSFLKRSARLIIFLRESTAATLKAKHKKKGIKKVTSEELTVSHWICPICTFENETKGTITESSPNVVCVNCGIPTDYDSIKESLRFTKTKGSGTQNVCPSCTFINHPYLTNCELCGTRLANSQTNSSSLHEVTSKVKLGVDSFVQLSFRKSDGTLFSQALDKLLDGQHKHDIFNKDVVSVNGVAVNENEIKRFQDSFTSGSTSTNNIELLQDKFGSVGISGLERTRETQLANNDILFTSALSDMNKLISLANNIERLFNKTSGVPSVQKDIPGTSTSLIIDRDKFLNKDLFLDEIARDIYEYSIAEFRDSSNNGNIMITLVDLYAMYNKAMRICTGLISPEEMREACGRFEKLGLRELKLMKINDRILCISSTNSLNYVSAQIMNYATKSPGSDILKISQFLNDGSTKGNWTVGVVVEILQYCVDEGVLVLDEQLTGIYYYKNDFWK